MSRLIAAYDLCIVMLEIAIENLFVPWNTEFDEAILKRTAVAFRIFEHDWTSIFPQRSDHRPYRGSNYENENFHGGRSLVFSMPELTFEKATTDNTAEIQLCVAKEISEHFEIDAPSNVGFTVVNVNDLLNGIVKELQYRREFKDHLSNFQMQKPVSRSMKGRYPLFNEKLQMTDGSIELYVRISYLGKCVISEIQPVEGTDSFFVRQEHDERHPYQIREITPKELQAGCWGSNTLFVSHGRTDFYCHCAELRFDKAEGTTAKKRRRKRDSPGAHLRAKELHQKRLLAMIKALKNCLGPGTVGLTEKTESSKKCLYRSIDSPSKYRKPCFTWCREKCIPCYTSTCYPYVCSHFS